MSRLNPISSRPGSHGPALPPHTGGGGDDDRNSRGGMPDSMPNYGERLRRARLGLAVAMTPILMLFISFTAGYLARRGFPNFDLTPDRYVRAWPPVLLPWSLLLINSAVLV